MSNQQKLLTDITPDEDNVQKSELDFTQIKINELQVLAEKTDAVIDRSSEPYIKGTYKNATPINAVKPFGRMLGGFDLDPCASENSVLAQTNIRRDGGLIYDWSNHDKIWCNPPYEQYIVPKWIKKAINTNAETVVMLLRGDPSTEWYQDLVEPHADLLYYPDDRISFGNRDNTTNVANLYVVFGSYPSELRDYCEQNGWVPKPEPAQNTLHANPQNAETLLEQTGMEDTLQIFFEHTPDVIDTETPMIELSPLYKQRIAEDEMSDIHIDSNTNAKQAFLEVTGVYSTDNSADDHLGVIHQSCNNPNEINFYITDEDQLGFIKYPVEKIRFTPTVESTTQYAMSVEKTVKSHKTG